MDGFRVASVLLVHEAVDQGLASIAAEFAARGLRVAGFLQTRLAEGGMVVRDLAGGGIYRVTQDLGRGSRGCRLDPGGLAEASGAALAALDVGADLLLIPRFGKAEAEGHGFRTVIERACEAQIPVLVAVRPAFEGAWDAFSGGLAEKLAPDPQVMLAWCRAEAARYLAGAS